MNHPHSRPSDGMRLALNLEPTTYSNARLAVELRKHLGDRAKSTYARVFRWAWEDAKAEAARRGVDWRAWLLAHQTGQPLPKHTDSPPPIERESGPESV